MHSDNRILLNVHKFNFIKFTIFSSDMNYEKKNESK